MDYCANDLDREIINYLNQHQGATTPELAKAIGTDRWTILSRLRQIGKRSKKELGKAIVEFDAGERAGKKRAWWLTFKE
jgi:predicted transcriptional regulator